MHHCLLAIGTVTDTALQALARQAGIVVDWTDAMDRPQTVGIETLRRILTALDLPNRTESDIAESRARLERDKVEEQISQSERCFGIDDVAPDARLWGSAVQLYGLRREGDGGIGDFGGAAAMARGIAPFGADALALSPTHALFSARPNHYAPYAPSSRAFLNPLLADPALVFGNDRVAQAQTNHDALIDWPARSQEKLALFRALFQDFGNDPLHADFERFQAERGTALRRHALFEALDAQAENHDWRRWPEAWRDPARVETSLSFVDGDGLQFHVFLQWLAYRSMAAAQIAAREAGLRIGLIADIAVGVDPTGSDAWSQQSDMLTGLSIGAPPDLFNPQGQNWGLTTLSPRALASGDDAPFIDILRTNMSCAGGIRVDHAMGLRRLWLIPDGASPGEGAYLTYPFELLLRQIARESRRHRAIVIAEDLGTVPPGLSERLNEAGILGMRILWFERDGERFMLPDAWRREAVAMTSTHDLPTVAGWWRGDDIATRDALGFYREAQTTSRVRGQRRRDRKELWHALVAGGCATGPQPPSRSTAAITDGAIRLVARTPARLALIPFEDLVGEKDQPNLPGTVTEHPNWRRRQKATTKKLMAAPKVAARLAALKHERGRP
jgi:4-alpha-glucanotransferase